MKTAKRVIVIASGETERRALPHLAQYLQDDSITADEVRIPPRNRALDGQMAENLIKAAWYENLGARPDKFVVLIDLDGADPEHSLDAIRNRLSGLKGRISADVNCAYAQEHLEAWYFANAEKLRIFLGRALGEVDTSRPDEIQNPKLHLKHLLGERVYTARVSEEIAKMLDAGRIAGRSPSFKKFIEAIANGSIQQHQDPVG